MTTLEKEVHRVCRLLCQQILYVYGQATIGEIAREAGKLGRRPRKRGRGRRC